MDAIAARTTTLAFIMFASLLADQNLLLYYCIRGWKQWSERARGSVWAVMQEKPIIHVIGNAGRAGGIELWEPTRAVSDWPERVTTTVTILASVPEGRGLGVSTVGSRWRDSVGWATHGRDFKSLRPTTNCWNDDLKSKGTAFFRRSGHYCD